MTRGSLGLSQGQKEVSVSHSDDDSGASVPSSPANPESVAARMSRAVRRASLRVHVKRMLVISIGVLVVGAAISVYLSQVGTKRCWVEVGVGERCVVTEWYPLTLQRRSQVETLNGELHGTRTEWFANGNVWISGTYEHGKRQRLWQENWPSGELRFSGEYLRDKLHGTESWWYANGQIEWQVHREHGERNGQEIWWHQNGNRRRVGNFENGQRHGVFSFFGPGGAPAFSVEYHRGTRLTKAVAGQDDDKEI